MTTAAPDAPQALDARKFRNPRLTAAGEPRASVGLTRLDTLWFNTGTLCNLTCENCYIESSPTNDRLAYLSAADVAGFLGEIERDSLGTREIGFTGGEPFMNPEIIASLEDCLARGFRVLVLTNAMRPMMKLAGPLLALRERYGETLVIRVSVDHYSRDLHQLERGQRSWEPTIRGLRWLADNGFAFHVAGRTMWGEPDAELREGYARLFARLGLAVDASDPAALVLFPEMDAGADVPEITDKCWALLGVSPGDMMCATSRMVVRRKDADRPSVAACTLLPYDAGFDLGSTLADARGEVSLNHPHCARFCVLGGGSCSSA